MQQNEIPKLISSKRVFSGYFSVDKDILESESGYQYEYFSLETSSPAVIVLAQTVERDFVLVEEYRHPAKKVLLSCAGGYVENGEDPLVAAKRELEEETGYSAQEFEMLGVAYPYAGISGQSLYYVLARNAERVAGQKLEGSEIVKVLVKSERELKEALRSGVPLDGNLCTALCFCWNVQRP